MNIIILSLGTFLLVLFCSYLLDFIKHRKFNKWITGIVDKIELAGPQEIWTIRWKSPEYLKDKNPGQEGYQYFYWKFSHQQNFNNVEDRNNYLNQKILKHVSEKFYLALKVDKNGVIREIDKYRGNLQKTIVYGLILMIYIGVIFKFHLLKG